MTGPYVALEKPFRDALCHHLHKELLLSGNCPLTPAAKVRPFKTAWSDISSASIVRVSEKCYMSDSVNETENDTPWVEDEENSSSMDESAEHNLLTK